MKQEKENETEERMCEALKGSHVHESDENKTDKKINSLHTS